MDQLVYHYASKCDPQKCYSSFKGFGKSANEKLILIGARVEQKVYDIDQVEKI